MIMKTKNCPHGYENIDNIVDHHELMQNCMSCLKCNDIADEFIKIGIVNAGGIKKAREEIK